MNTNKFASFIVFLFFTENFMHAYTLLSNSFPSLSFIFFHIYSHQFFLPIMCAAYVSLLSAHDADYS